jgi:phytanoyl-CoA hydroxylase
MIFSLLRTKRVLDFDSSTLPWTDREEFDRDAEERVMRGDITFDDSNLLRQWRRDGFIVLKNVVDTVCIEELLAHYYRAWEERPMCNILWEGGGVTRLSDAPSRDELTHHHYRLMDFHNLSEAGRSIALHPTIIKYVRLILDDDPVCMQSLFFEYGSEQGMHQDFPWVCPDILSHLIGCFVACEDSKEENGGLMYYPGSHLVRKFDFGNGSIKYTGGNEEKVKSFEEHLFKECKRMGLQEEILRVHKGDVLLWHAALVHGGSLVVDKNATRKSFVLHYSSKTAYPRDRRSPASIQRSIAQNGGQFYVWDKEGHIENRYCSNGVSLIAKQSSG